MVAALPDPVNEVLEEWTRPNGLLIRKFVAAWCDRNCLQSRPNVTVDAATLAWRLETRWSFAAARKAALSSQVLTEIMARFQNPAGAIDCWIPAHAILSRTSFGHVVLWDVVIPRGGRALICTVMEHAVVPVIETGRAIATFLWMSLLISRWQAALC